MEPRYKRLKVTAEQWADHCSNYRTISTEINSPDLSTMVSRHHRTGEVIGEVDYFSDGRKDYWIYIDRISPVLVYGVSEAGVATVGEV